MAGIFLRGVLRAPDDGGDGGGGKPSGEGGEKTFTQSELDVLIQKRVGPLTDKLKSYEKTIAEELEPMRLRLAEREAEVEKAREEEALKGKSELEKAKLQLEKSMGILKQQEADFAKKSAELQAEAQRARNGFIDYVKRSHIASALHDAGVRSGASKHALHAFVSESEIELSDAQEVSRVTVAGRTFETTTEAAAHFLSQYPHFSEPKPGGAGTPTRPGAGPTKVSDNFNVVSLLNQGHAERQQRSG